MRKTEHHTIEGNRKTKNSIKRLFFCLLAIFLQIAFFLSIMNHLNTQMPWINALTKILVLILVLYIYSKNKTSSLKMPWIILILVMPVLGVCLYLMFQTNKGTHNMRKRYQEIDAILLPCLPPNHEISQQLKKHCAPAGSISDYLYRNAAYPVYQNTDVTYYPEAVQGLEAQLADLAKAEKFIFMEYHAIENADAWQKIQTVLAERVQAGVEVRVFYDDMGSISFLNHDFAKQLEALGIACRVFNPFVPGVNLFLNNRDHRKITVIDGKIGFTGGYNLANEYFGFSHPYGEWKDTGIRLEGDAVRSLTITFLEMWNAIKKNLPYADSPLDDEQVGEEVYISMANKAEHYCWFITPYLIITDELSHALSLAAKRGVDVRIITPGIPDKKMVYSVTRSFYHQLVSSGVHIFEWTPGFCHAKMSIADDRMATCGTINLDYRSLYHHFENGCFMVDCPAVMDIKHDFRHTFSQCRDVTEKYKTGLGAHLRLGQLILRLFAQLL